MTPWRRETLLLLTRSKMRSGPTELTLETSNVSIPLLVRCVAACVLQACSTDSISALHQPELLSGLCAGADKDNWLREADVSFLIGKGPGEADGTEAVSESEGETVKVCLAQFLLSDLGTAKNRPLSIHSWKRVTFGSCI